MSDFRNKIFSFERIGRWWNKEEEIDIIGVNKKTQEIIFGECKWSDNLVDKPVFYDLKRKSVEVKWNNEQRKEYFIIFSKSGFTKGMIALAKEENIFLVKGGDPVNF